MAKAIKDEEIKKEEAIKEEAPKEEKVKETKKEEKVVSYKITVKNKNFTGEAAGVQFVDGVGTTSNEVLIDYFKEKGYTVEEQIQE